MTPEGIIVSRNISSPTDATLLRLVVDAVRFPGKTPHQLVKDVELGNPADQNATGLLTAEADRNFAGALIETVRAAMGELPNAQIAPAKPRRGLVYTTIVLSTALLLTGTLLVRSTIDSRKLEARLTAQEQAAKAQLDTVTAEYRTKFENLQQEIGSMRSSVETTAKTSDEKLQQSMSQFAESLNRRDSELQTLRSENQQLREQLAKAKEPQSVP